MLSLASLGCCDLTQSAAGIAGGQKFVVANIVFKFAQDTLLPSGEYVHGASTPNEEAAHKSAGTTERGSAFSTTPLTRAGFAGHERKGINCIISRAPPNVAVPLMTLVIFLPFFLATLRSPFASGRLSRLSAVRTVFATYQVCQPCHFNGWHHSLSINLSLFLSHSLSRAW